MSTYSDKLKDPRWQKKRLEIMQRDDFTCRVCGDKDNTLHVHHIRYLNGYQPWDYKDFYLVTLCHKCHEAEEAEITKSNRPPGWKEPVKPEFTPEVAAALELYQSLLDQMAEATQPPFDQERVRAIQGEIQKINMTFPMVRHIRDQQQAARRGS